jgi:hypothetical protein
LHLD